MPPVPKAVRVRTGSGWQDIALIGPPGPAGPAGTPTPLVTTLPVSPVDGQEVYFLASDAAGIIWHLRYRAASTSPYKWEFVGGSPLVASNPASINVTPGGINDPSLTVPRAGEYRFEAYWTNAPGATTRTFAYVAVSNPSLAPSFGEGDSAYVGATGGSQGRPMSAGLYDKITCAAGATVNLRLDVNTGSNDTQNRRIVVTPWRVA